MEDGSDKVLCTAMTHTHMENELKLAGNAVRSSSLCVNTIRNETLQPLLAQANQSGSEVRHTQSENRNHAELNLTIPSQFRNIRSALNFIRKNNLSSKGISIQICESVPDGLFELVQKILRFRCKVDIACVRPTFIREGTWKLDTNSTGSAFAVKLFDRFGYTVIIRGGPWTFENCELKNIMGAAIRMEEAAVSTFMVCAVGGECERDAQARDAFWLTDRADCCIKGCTIQYCSFVAVALWNSAVSTISECAIRHVRVAVDLNDESRAEVRDCKLESVYNGAFWTWTVGNQKTDSELVVVKSRISCLMWWGNGRPKKVVDEDNEVQPTASAAFAAEYQKVVKRQRAQKDDDSSTQGSNSSVHIASDFASYDALVQSNEQEDSKGDVVPVVSPFKGSLQRNESKPEVALKMSLGGWLEPVSVDLKDERRLPASSPEGSRSEWELKQVTGAGAARPERRWRISGRKAKRVK
ncbi:hypothetical protein GUITHDRAFT_165935 [Guillardia theta CCMP2712]|uniref:Right handed beta helix domain-containing protein n=1 Tax=Guillardia theta (strain CCMP2712) TaxID=905079 RepID=L1IIA5_GUITC|nr:hypothetical protein GUITHDRAFT_165935 [Guillardia theta CCMP2712]EKX35550.1 hypothetical protein GUITHDRAFT_165935 [Guillardia theta CCMP2712]|eukprot:XP_005822530.1 hypothetical protein GUITHDRAFT_165935 [Guillardia theta CCMP2712]